MGLLLFADTETSGLPDIKKPSDDPSQPHIGSFCAILCDEKTLNTYGLWYMLVKPVGWSMDAPECARAKEVNGLSDELLNRMGQPPQVAFGQISYLFSLGVTLVAHSAGFDHKMFRGEMRRLGLPEYYDQTPTFCTMHNSTQHCQLEPKKAKRHDKDFKQPKLSEALKFWTGKELPNAHGALQDTMAVKSIYTAMKQKGIDLSPKMPKSADQATFAPRPGSQPKGPTFDQPPMEPTDGKVISNNPVPSAPVLSLDDEDGVF